MEIFEGHYEKIGLVQDCLDMHLPMELIFICVYKVITL